MKKPDKKLAVATQTIRTLNVPSIQVAGALPPNTRDTCRYCVPSLAC